MDALRFDHSPFMRFLGLEVVRADKGVIEVRLPFREEFLRNDGSDWLHGGVVSSLADIVGDYAVVTETGQGVPTIDLRVDYLRPARRGDLLAIGRTLRVGRTVSVADVHAFPGHIACDSQARSEIVVPVLGAGRLLALLDVDSHLPAAFSGDDERGLGAVADVIGRAWPAG